MIGIETPTVQSRLQTVRDRIHSVCDKTGRDPDTITLVAVTKGFPGEIFHTVSELGLNHVGENRVREAVRRKEELGEPAEGLQWHMVGHVQSNKVKYLLGEFDLIHSLDRTSLLDELQKRLEREGVTQRVLLQVNCSGEESKYGATPDEAPALLEEILEASQLRVDGLMTMAPRTDDESVLRETFASCRELRDTLQQDFGVELPELSMGMTNDYPQAVREGSTMLRIGRGLFGERPT